MESRLPSPGQPAAKLGSLPRTDGYSEDLVPNVSGLFAFRESFAS
jgi:hypothetical protein